MRRTPLLVAAFVVAFAAFSGCTDTLKPDWAVGDDDAARLALSAQPGRGHVSFHFSTTGVGSFVLYVSSNGGAATRWADVTSPFTIASGTSAAVFSAQVALLVSGTEGSPTAAVSAREHRILADEPAWSLAPEAGARTGYPVAGVGDLNDDGFADIAIGSYQWTNSGTGETEVGKVEIFYGGPTGIGSAADVTLVGEASGDHFGAGLAGAGDVNGDGIGDLIVGAPDFGAGDAGKAYLYFGSAVGISTTPSDTYVSLQDGAYLGRFVAPGGDSQDDGFDEVIISMVGYSIPGHAPSTGMARVLHGTADGFGDIDYDYPADTATGLETGDRYGWSLSPRSGDANCDGLADVLIGGERAEGTQTSEGIATVLYGDPDTGIRGTGQQSTESNQVGAQTGAAVSWGDLDGDGCSDAIIAANLYDSFNGADAGILAVFFGAPGPPPVLTMPGSPHHLLFGEDAGDRFGESVGAADLDGDGRDELLVGAAFAEGGRGRIYVYQGLTPLGSTPSEPVWTWTGQPGNFAGGTLANAGDINGDGLDDLLVGTAGRIEEAMPTAPGAWLFYGLPTTGPRIDLGIPSPVMAGDASVPLFPDAVVTGTTGLRSCAVDFGIGPVPIVPCNQEELRAISNVYFSPGLYDVVVTAIDVRGQETSATVQVLVR